MQGREIEMNTAQHTHAEKIAVKKPKQTPNVIDRKMLQFAHLRQEHQNQTSKPANQTSITSSNTSSNTRIRVSELFECRVPSAIHNRHHINFTQCRTLPLLTAPFVCVCLQFEFVRQMWLNTRSHRAGNLPDYDRCKSCPS